MANKKLHFIGFSSSIRVIKMAEWMVNTLKKIPTKFPDEKIFFFWLRGFECWIKIKLAFGSPIRRNKFREKSKIVILKNKTFSNIQKSIVWKIRQFFSWYNSILRKMEKLKRIRKKNLLFVEEKLQVSFTLWFWTEIIIKIIFYGKYSICEKNKLLL